MFRQAMTYRRGNGNPPTRGFVQIPFGQSRYHADRGEFDLALRLDLRTRSNAQFNVGGAYPLSSVGSWACPPKAFYDKALKAIGIERP
jgi:hypothetical protein